MHGPKLGGLGNIKKELQLRARARLGEVSSDPPTGRDTSEARQSATQVRVQAEGALPQAAAHPEDVGRMALLL